MIRWPHTSWDNILTEINAWKKNGKTIVFTNGCFDLLHPGHLHTLDEAKKFGDKLVVGLNTDDSVRRLKGKDRPIKDETSRGAVLGAIRGVDMVILFSQDTPLELIKLIKPDVLVKGGDYEHHQIVGAQEVLLNGGQVKIVPLLEGYSTSNWINPV